jgi:hypothetical protein
VKTVQLAIASDEDAALQPLAGELSIHRSRRVPSPTS